MGYKIQYTPCNDRRYPPVARSRRGKGGGLWVLLVLVLAFVCLCYNGVPEFLIPGDPQVTRAAAAEMVALIQEGSAVQDAVVIFCKQVLDGASV